MRSPDPYGARLDAKALTVSIGGVEIIRGIDLVAAPGELIGIIGPNGSGKSTLLRALARLVRPSYGSVLVDGDDLWHLTVKETARRLAIVLQDHPGDVDLTVREVVELGRWAHRRTWSGVGEPGHEIVAAALAEVGAEALAERAFTSLSGGEGQRVLIARSLAQQARVLLLDEPTNHLDIRAQLDLLALIRKLPVTTVCVLHDLDQAAALCDRVYLLNRGRVVAAGPPDTVLTADRVRDVFGVRMVEGHVAGRERPHLMFEALDEHLTDRAGRSTDRG